MTEANSQGTPAIAYDADGLRDSIIDGKTGMLVRSGDEYAFKNAINQLLKNEEKYEDFRREAWLLSKQYTFDNSYSDFLIAAGIYCDSHSDDS